MISLPCKLSILTFFLFCFLSCLWVKASVMESDYLEYIITSVRIMPQVQSIYQIDQQETHGTLLCGGLKIYNWNYNLKVKNLKSKVR